MKKLTKLQVAIRAVDDCMKLLGGPGSAQEEAWKTVRCAAELGERSHSASQPSGADNSPMDDIAHSLAEWAFKYLPDCATRDSFRMVLIEQRHQ